MQWNVFLIPVLNTVFDVKVQPLSYWILCSIAVDLLNIEGVEFTGNPFDLYDVPRLAQAPSPEDDAIYDDPLDLDLEDMEIYDYPPDAVELGELACDSCCAD